MKIKFFIGYDEAEIVAYHALVQSIIKHCSVPFSVEPLIRGNLPVPPCRDKKASTDFADTRFLVPWLCNYEGWAIFIDCDELFTFDPKKLWELREDRYAVMVRQHDYTPASETKFLNQKQYKYSRKNWSSLILFNCEKCRILTPAFVGITPGIDLHQFKWTQDIGALPEGWNHLVGEQEWDQDYPPMLIHYTNGGPYFYNYKDCDFAEEWLKMQSEMNYVKNDR